MVWSARSPYASRVAAHPGRRLGEASDAEGFAGHAGLCTSESITIYQGSRMTPWWHGDHIVESKGDLNYNARGRR